MEENDRERNVIVVASLLVFIGIALSTLFEMYHIIIGG